MDLYDTWQSTCFDHADFPGGQSSFNSVYTNDPGLFDGEGYGINGSMCLPFNDVHPGQNGAGPYGDFLSSTIPFDDCGDQQNMSLEPDSYEYILDKRASQSPHPPSLKEEPGMTRSTSSTETDYSNEDDHQRHSCQECKQSFRNLQELDQHARRTPHKAWRCHEPFCDKIYARRDTLLRHRATHKDKGHACNICPHFNKQKVFKRKDHLKEHIRNCHSKGVEATSVEGVKWV